MTGFLTSFRFVRPAVALLFLALLAALAFAAAPSRSAPVDAPALSRGDDVPDCKKDQLPGKREKHGKMIWKCVTIPQEILGTFTAEYHYKASPACAKDFDDYKRIKAAVLMRRGPFTRAQKAGKDDPVAYKLSRSGSSNLGWSYNGWRAKCNPGASLHIVMDERADDELNSESNLQYTALDGSYGWAVGANYEPHQFTTHYTNGTPSSHDTDWTYAPGVGGAGHSYSPERMTRQVIDLGAEVCSGCRPGSYEKTTWKFVAN